jgi:hypothetical protein
MRATHPSFAASSGTVDTAQVCNGSSSPHQFVIMSHWVNREDGSQGAYLTLCRNHPFDAHPSTIFGRNPTNFTIQNRSTISHLPHIFQKKLL